jgi:hypothetical protein
MTDSRVSPRVWLQRPVGGARAGRPSRRPWLRDAVFRDRRVKHHSPLAARPFCAINRWNGTPPFPEAR